jgi:hypothetical protein
MWREAANLWLAGGGSNTGRRKFFLLGEERSSEAAMGGEAISESNIFFSPSAIPEDVKSPSRGRPEFESQTYKFF